MSRNWLGIGLILCSGACLSQTQPGLVYSPVTESGLTNPDVRNKSADPAAVEIPLYAGAPVRDVLEALKNKGFAIKWNPEEVLPTMTLLEKPKSTRIDKLLTEILTPYDLKADHNMQDGGWRVRPVKKKKKEVIVEEPQATSAG